MGIRPHEDLLGAVFFSEMSTPERVVLQTPAISPGILALGNIIPFFGGNGSDREFLDVLE